MRIPGLPGANDPTFRTRDALLLSLDRIVQEVCMELADEGMLIAPRIAKTAIQAARQQIAGRGTPSPDELVERIRLRLRNERILLPAPMIHRLLEAYLRKVVELEITEVSDFRAG